MQSYKIERAPSFDDSMSDFRDQKALKLINAAIAKAEAGNFGHTARINYPGVTNCFEITIDHGPGYRAYCLKEGDKIVLLLCGIKKTQARDIRRLQALIERHRETRV